MWGKNNANKYTITHVQNQKRKKKVYCSLNKIVDIVADSIPVLIQGPPSSAVHAMEPIEPVGYNTQAN